MSFLDNVRILVMVRVKMTPEACTKTLTALPTHLEQLTLHSIIINYEKVDPLCSLDSTIPDKLITSILMDTIHNLSQNLKLLHISQKAVLENIDVALPRALEVLCLEQIIMKASSWMRVFYGVKEMRWKPVFHDCIMYPLDESDIARESYGDFSLIQHKGKLRYKQKI